jgi:hypothetical protein
MWKTLRPPGVEGVESLEGVESVEGVDPASAPESESVPGYELRILQGATPESMSWMNLMSPSI